MNIYSMALGVIVVAGVAFVCSRVMDHGYEFSAGASLTSLDFQLDLTKAAA